MAEHSERSRQVLVLGATGTIGQAVMRALPGRGYRAVGVTRRGPAEAGMRIADVGDPGCLLRDGFRGERFDAVISCLASRTGAPGDAWAVDHRANVSALTAAKQSGVAHFVLLSAICVQKPLLAFQHAKLAFEADLAGSGIAYSIVRPTAFFKSLSGQLERLRRGKPFLLFGDGRLTACKPISARDLAHFLIDCLEDPAKHNRILPIGGPGAAITPLEQGEMLFSALGREPRFRRVPIGLLDGIIWLLSQAGRLNSALAEKAELARIGRYYATESMLLLGPDGTYRPDLTPSTGHETLADYYRALVSGAERDDRGDHAVF